MKLNITPESCWYKDACSESGTTDCTIYCIRFGQMKHMIETSNLPRKFCYPTKLVPESRDLKAFQELNEIRLDIVNFVMNGENLYIQSANSGNGKTSWASKLLLRYFDRVWDNNCYNERGRFVSVPELLMSIKLAPYKDQTITTELNKLKSLDIVIWDDIGGTTANQNELDLLFSIISYRIANGLTNIFTGHLDYEDLAQKVGSRLADSIYNNSIVVQFKGVDRRAQQ